jgi:hypothetical protein
MAVLIGALIAAAGPRHRLQAIRSPARRTLHLDRLGHPSRVMSDCHESGNLLKPGCEGREFTSESRETGKTPNGASFAAIKTDDREARKTGGAKRQRAFVGRLCQCT